MAAILYAYHDGEWKRERFQSLGDARRVAYLGEQSGILTPLKIDVERYHAGRTETRTNWKRSGDEGFGEYAREHLTHQDYVDAGGAG